MLRYRPTTLLMAICFARSEAKMLGGSVDFVPGDRSDGLGVLVPGPVVYSPTAAGGRTQFYTDAETTKKASAAVEAHKAYCAVYVGSGLLQIKTSDHKTLYANNSVDWTSSTDASACDKVIPKKPAAAKRQANRGFHFR